MTLDPIPLEPIRVALAKPRADWRSCRWPALWAVMAILAISFAGLWRTSEAERKQLQRSLAEQRTTAEKERLQSEFAIQGMRTEKAHAHFGNTELESTKQPDREIVLSEHLQRTARLPSRELRRAECQYADAMGDAVRLSAITAEWAAVPVMSSDERYELATWYARLANAVEADLKLDPGERKKIAEDYSAETVRQLKWVDPLERGRIAKDPHFALLRDREDFKDLLR